VGEPQLDRCTALRPELSEYNFKARRSLPRVEFTTEFRKRCKFILRLCLFRVDTATPATLEERMLLYQVVRYRIKIVNGISDHVLIPDPQHPQVHLLCQICSVRVKPHPSLEKCP